MPRVGRHGIRLEVYLDAPAMAVLNELQGFYQEKISPTGVSHSQLIRRSLESLRKEVSRLQHTPESTTAIQLEVVYFGELRRARR